MLHTNEVSPGDNKIAISNKILSESSPFIIREISDTCLLLIFYNPFEKSNLKISVQPIIDAVDQYDADYIIVDLSKFDSIDRPTISQLKKLNKLLHLLCIKVIYCGIQSQVVSEVAMTGISKKKITVEKDLKRAIIKAYQNQGIELIPFKH